jgi:hypothetical protein
VEACLLILGKEFLDQGNCHESVALTSKGWFKHNPRSALAAIKQAQKRPIGTKTEGLAAGDSTFAAQPKSEG